MGQSHCVFCALRKSCATVESIWGCRRAHFPHGFSTPYRPAWRTGLPHIALGSRTTVALSGSVSAILAFAQSKYRALSGTEQCVFRRERVLTITYAVGGAGAQKEIGSAIARSLAGRIRSGDVALNLVAGTRTEVRDYFLDVQNTILPGSQNLRVHYAATPQEYFEQFSRVLREQIFSGRNPANSPSTVPSVSRSL